MSAPSRREQLAEKFADSSFAKNVLGPKVVEPLHQWYQDTVQEQPAQDQDQPDNDAATQASTEPPASVTLAPTEPETQAEGAVSGSLASAQSAEAFLAGADAQTEPEERPAPAPTPEPAQEETDEAPVVAPPTGFAGIKDILMRLKDRVKDHNLNVVAAGVAFWGLLAIPAVLTAVVSIYGLVSTPEEVEDQIDRALSNASEEMRELISGQLSSIASGTGGGLAIGAVVGIVLALWTSSGAVAKVMATLNTIWGVTEDRKFVKLRGTALIITVGAIVGVVVAAFLLAALPAVLNEVGMGSAGRWALNIGRFPAMLVFMAVGLSVLYWIAPNLSRRYRVITWGAVWATILWLALSAAFSVYTANFATYNETYGAIGGVVVLLLWLFITAFMVLIGAEIDAIRDQRRAEKEAAAATSESSS